MSGGLANNVGNWISPRLCDCFSCPGALNLFSLVSPVGAERTMQLKLKVLDGSQQGTEISVPGPKFLVGRDEDCHLRPKSDVISRHHCVVILEQGYAGVRDFNSKNGTFVNGERVAGERELKSGDELVIGPLRFAVQLDLAVGGKKKPKVKDIKEAAARTVQMAGGDLDITEWLGDDADDGNQEDTRSTLMDVNLTGQTGAGVASPSSDTAEINLKKDETLPHGDKKAGKKEPGKLPTDLRVEEPEKPIDTRAAAMDVLRKMRQQNQQKSGG